MTDSLFARARFMAALVLRVARRALPAPTLSDYEGEDLIEAIITGDVDVLETYGQGLAYARHPTGTPWFFIALECGNLSTVDWFLSHGADPCAPDPSGRLPLEAIFQRIRLADDLDDHLADCGSIAHTLIANGADLAAKTILGESLSDLAAASGLSLP